MKRQIISTSANGSELIFEQLDIFQRTHLKNDDYFHVLENCGRVYRHIHGLYAVDILTEKIKIIGEMAVIKLQKCYLEEK